MNFLERLLGEYGGASGLSAQDNSMLRQRSINESGMAGLMQILANPQNPWAGLTGGLLGSRSNYMAAVDDFARQQAEDAMRERQFRLQEDNLALSRERFDAGQVQKDEDQELARSQQEFREWSANEEVKNRTMREIEEAEANDTADAEFQNFITRVRSQLSPEDAAIVESTFKGMGGGRTGFSAASSEYNTITDNVRAQESADYNRMLAQNRESRAAELHSERNNVDPSVQARREEEMAREAHKATFNIANQNLPGFIANLSRSAAAGDESARVEISSVMANLGVNPENLTEEDLVDSRFWSEVLGRSGANVSVLSNNAYSKLYEESGKLLSPPTPENSAPTLASPEVRVETSEDISAMPDEEKQAILSHGSAEKALEVFIAENGYDPATDKVIIDIARRELEKLFNDKSISEKAPSSLSTAPKGILPGVI